jgi:hypothetical protein
LILLIKTSAAVVGALVEILLRNDSEQPVHPEPCNQITFGPLVLASTFWSLPKSEALKPNAAAPIPQNFKKLRLEIFFNTNPLDNIESAYANSTHPGKKNERVEVKIFGVSCAIYGLLSQNYNYSLEIKSSIT